MSQLNISSKFFKFIWIYLTLTVLKTASQCPSISNSDMNLTLAPLNLESKSLLFHNDSFVAFNGTRAELRFNCSSSQPLAWNFYFDRAINYWSDNVGYQSSRTFSNFTDPSTYRYSTELKLWLFNKPQITKSVTCQQILKDCDQEGSESNDPTKSSITVSSVMTPTEGDVNEFVTYGIDDSAEPNKAPKVEETSDCSIVHLVKELSPTKLLWNCEQNGTYADLWFGSTWSCTTIPRCTHYFYTTQTKKACMKFLKDSEPCPGKCAVSSTLAPAGMHCQMGDILNQRMVPLVYSVSLKNGLPQRFYHWSWKTQELLQMVDFVQIPDGIYLEEEITLRCKVSEAYFALGVKFGIKFGTNETLTILEGETSQLIRHVNQRVYTLALSTVNHSLIDVQNIYCLAPVWNSTEWINKSHSITFHNRKRTGECSLEKDNPTITIIPDSFALFSTPENLVLTGKNFSFNLNCTFKEPVKWIFNFEKFDKDKDFETVSERRLVNNELVTRTVLRLKYQARPKSTEFTCQSIHNPCKRSTAKLTQSQQANTVISVSGVPDLSLNSEVKECRNMFRIRPTSLTTFEWECRSTVDNADMATSEIPCKDPLTCSNYFDNAVQNDACFQFLKPGDDCKKCRINEPPKEGRFYPRYLYCGMIYTWRTYQFVFYSMVKYNGTRKMYFRLSDAEPEDMMETDMVPSVVYFGKSFKIGCNFSSFYFAEGAYIKITTVNRTIILDDSTASKEMETHSKVISKRIEFDLKDVGPIEVTCLAPIIFSKSDEWVMKSQKTELKVHTGLAFLDDKNLTFVEISPGDDHTLLCDVRGDPAPVVSWDLPQHDLVVQHGIDGLFHKLVLTDVSSLYEGVYKCTGTNGFETVSKIFQVDIKDRSSARNITIIVVTVSIVVAILATALVHYVRRSRKLQRVVQFLSEEEVTAFLTGNLADRCGFHDSVIPVFCVPYNMELEIPRDKILIEEENILGMGEFGMVFKGKVLEVPQLLAIKTSKQNIDVDQFKAMLTEIKVMAHLGSHENIVHFIGACTANIQNGEVFIAIELCDQGNLQSFLVNNRKAFIDENGQLFYADLLDDNNGEYKNIGVKFSTKNLIVWSFQIANGMAFLESKNVIHGDLAGRNILLGSNLTAKISDFGLSRQLANYTSYVKTSHCALPWRWMSVEALRDMAFSIQSDIWSYGVTLWEIFSLGQIPYPGLNWSVTFVDQLTEGLRLQKPQHADDEIYQKMIACWDPLPSKRFNFGMYRQFFEQLRGNEDGTDAAYANVGKASG